MQDDWKMNGPVVIGGLGGSGTRVVAEIMAYLGFFIGRDLNVASDNLWFTFLFKRPSWYPKHRYDQDTIDAGLRLLEKTMLGTSALTGAEYRYLWGALKSACRDGFSHKHIGYGRTKWGLQRFTRILMQRPNPGQNYVGWGWKEPNSHLMIDDIARNFKSCKYIHTVRHGLDMAFSDNQNQLHLWGGSFNVNVPEDQQRLPQASYRYWVQANREARTRGLALGADRFMLLNFDQLCSDPDQQLQKLAGFLNRDLPDHDLVRIKALIKPLGSIGRHVKHGVEMFRGEDLSALTEFGFPPVEGQEL